jgi:hypothetical protein
MHTAMEPARNPANLDPGEDPAAGLMSIVADMMSLIIMSRPAASAHFPKSALHRRNAPSRTSESYGH